MAESLVVGHGDFLPLAKTLSPLHVALLKVRPCIPQTLLKYNLYVSVHVEHSCSLSHCLCISKYAERQDEKHIQTNTQIYETIHTSTHIHIHIYVHIYVCVCVFKCHGLTFAKLLPTTQL